MMGLYFYQIFLNPKGNGKVNFYDFYELINFTCKLISNNNLNIALKPHPNIYNINKESVKVVEQLKQNIKTCWISPSYQIMKYLNQ